MNKLAKLGLVAGVLAVGGCESDRINPDYQMTANDSVIVEMTKNVGKTVVLREIKAEICAQQGCSFQDAEKHANMSTSWLGTSAGEIQDHLLIHERVSGLPLSIGQVEAWKKAEQYNRKVEGYKEQ